MLYAPYNDWGFILDSSAGVRPASAMGQTVTPGNNTKGSYSTAIITGSNLTQDVYGILVHMNNGATTAAAREMIVDIGADPAGGTSYGVIIPDLLSCGPSAMETQRGYQYYFPLFIKAGTQLAARASVNNATVGVLSVRLKVFGMPRDPSAIRVGAYVKAYGIVAGSSRGTLITPGGASEGSYVSLGTTSHDNWWWELGMGVNDSTMTANILFGDLTYGDGSTKIPLLSDIEFVTTAAEAMGKSSTYGFNNMRFVKSGSELFVRAQNGGANDAAYSMAAYGCGG